MKLVSLALVVLPFVLCCGGAVSATSTDVDASAPPLDAAPSSSPATLVERDIPPLGRFVGDAGAADAADVDATDVDAAEDPCIPKPDGAQRDACGINGLPQVFDVSAACPYRGPGCVVFNDAILCCPQAP